MRKKFLFLAFFLLFFLYFSRFMQFSFCQTLKPQFHFSSAVLVEEVEKVSATDEDLPRNLVRFFHNKLNVGIFEISKRYFLSFEPKILWETISPLGTLLLIFGAYKIIKDKSKLGFLVLAFLFIAPFFLLRMKEPTSFLILLSMPREVVSFWGLPRFCERPQGIKLFLFALLLSFWYFVFSFRLASLCQ